MAAPSPVGMIGLGLMGAALAARLIEAGMRVIGFDIDAEKRKSFGGEAAACAEEAMARCRTVVITVYNARQVEAVLDDFRGAGPAGLVICTTTCAPDEILSLSNRAAQLNLRFVEAPISGTSAEVRAGSATALIAGEDATIGAAAAVLDILCPRPIWYCRTTAPRWRKVSRLRKAWGSMGRPFLQACANRPPIPG